MVDLAEARRPGPRADAGASVRAPGTRRPARGPIVESRSCISPLTVRLLAALLAKTGAGGEDPLFGLQRGQRAARRRALPEDPRPHRGPRRPGRSHIPGWCCAASPPRSSVRVLAEAGGIPTGGLDEQDAVQPARSGADAGGPARARRARTPSGRARRHAAADPARHEGGREAVQLAAVDVLQRPAATRRADRGAVPPAAARPGARQARARWDPRAAEQLAAAVDELPQRSRVFLLSRLRTAFLDEDDRRLLDEAAWIEKVEPTATQLLARGGAAAALALLRERRRPDGGPILPLAEIEALEALGAAGRGHRPGRAGGREAAARPRRDRSSSTSGCSSAGWPS